MGRSRWASRCPRPRRKRHRRRAGTPALTRRSPRAALVAIGDSDFAGNNALGVQGNQDFFLNTVNWLAQQENLIAIRPRDAQDRRLTLTADQQQRIFIFSVFLIPALVFAGGVWVWWKRR